MVEAHYQLPTIIYPYLLYPIPPGYHPFPIGVHPPWGQECIVGIPVQVRVDTTRQEIIVYQHPRVQAPLLGEGTVQGREAGKGGYYQDGVHRVPAVAVIPWNVPGDIPYTNTWVPQRTYSRLAPYLYHIHHILVYPLQTLYYPEYSSCLMTPISIISIQCKYSPVQGLLVQILHDSIVVLLSTVTRLYDY